MNNIGIWGISLVSILGILFRPWKFPEWFWAIIGSVLLLVFGFIPFKMALHAVSKGVDVYFFLIGMMLLSELARSEGVFDWLAAWASFHARGSSRRLFVLIYAAGILVTTFLSNDATAVVMTPAVYAAVKHAGAKPLPYLFACAFIANAASFVLPISNPANLVVFSSRLPGVISWIRMFALPSIVSITVTFLVLWFWFGRSLSVPLENHNEERKPRLTDCGKLTVAGLFLVVCVLLIASDLEWNLGLPTLLSAAAIVLGIAVRNRRWPGQVLKDVTWGIIPLVAGLFIIVEAMNQAGALKVTHSLLRSLSQFPELTGKLAAAFGVGITSNLMNNLPVGLVTGIAIHQNGISESIRNAVLVGVDLGPNLSVTGSLATILWLMALRREGEKISGFAFFRLGLVAMPLALGFSIWVL